MFSCCRSYSLITMNILATYLCIEELLVGLELRRQALIRVCQMLRLVAESLLESFEYVSLHVVGVELAFILLVLVDLVAHVFV